MTSSRSPDGQPAVARDGRIFFVRGRLGAAALWVHEPNGAESRVTKDHGAEQWPAMSPDGSRLAYVSIADGSHMLHVRSIDGGRGQRRARRPAHRASGLVAVRRSHRLDGARVRAARCTSRRSMGATRIWSARATPNRRGIPMERRSTLADLPTTDAIATVGYNGDPDRTGDRGANLLSAATGRLWTVDAPSRPDERLVAQSEAPSSATRSRAAQCRRIRPALESHGRALLRHARRGVAARARGKR